MPFRSSASRRSPAVGSFLVVCLVLVARPAMLSAQADDPGWSTRGSGGDTARPALAMDATLGWNADANALGLATDVEGIEGAGLDDAWSTRWQDAAFVGVGGELALVGQLAVLGGAHRGFRPVVPGLPDDASRAIDGRVELGLRWGEAASPVRASLSGFARRFTDPLAACRRAGGCGYELEDIEVAEHRSLWVGGVEASLEGELELARASLRWQASYASGLSMRSDTSTTDLVAKHAITVDVTVEHGPFALVVIAKKLWAASLEIDAETGESVDSDLATLDLRLEVEESARSRWTVSVENLTGARATLGGRTLGTRPTQPVVVAMAWSVAM